MKILTLCGAGIGTSGILKVNAERVLQRLGIDARVVAIDASMLESELDDAQVILTGPEFVDAIGQTFSLRAPSQLRRFSTDAGAARRIASMFLSCEPARPRNSGTPRHLRVQRGRTWGGS